MSAPAHLAKYCQYIRNTAQVPLLTDHFDDDWDPIGKMVRRQLVEHGLITETDGGCVLTDAGKAML